MNTEQLRYFVSVARYRNFTETAREFYVTQPAVTHQISALEREVGARLFLRTTRNVSLTRAGELFLEDAKRILDQEERARRAAAVAEEMHRSYLEGCVGRTYPVLFEQPKNGKFFGHAPNYMEVLVDGAELHNALRTVRITDVDGEALLGEIVEQEAET